MTTTYTETPETEALWARAIEVAKALLADPEVYPQTDPDGLGWLLYYAGTGRIYDAPPDQFVSAIYAIWHGLELGEIRDAIERVRLVFEAEETSGGDVAEGAAKDGAFRIAWQLYRNPDVYVQTGPIRVAQVLVSAVRHRQIAQKGCAGHATALSVIYHGTDYHAWLTAIDAVDIDE